MRNIDESENRHRIVRIYFLHGKSLNVGLNFFEELTLAALPGLRTYGDSNAASPPKPSVSAPAAKNQPDT